MSKLFDRFSYCHPTPSPQRAHTHTDTHTLHAISPQSAGCKKHTHSNLNLDYSLL